MEVKQERQDKAYTIKFSIDVEDRVAGWGFLIVIQNDRHKEPYGMMENIYIEEEFRGNGYGKKIVSTIIEKAKELGCYKLIAQSRHGKEGVHALYEKYGFRDHGKNFRMDLIDSQPLQSD